MKTKLFLISLILTFTSFAQLSGTYTIGGTNPDYTTFSDATTALSTDGVSGPVTFNIRPGTYTEQIIINHYTGASEINTITFQSETNNPEDVLINFTNVSELIQLNDADYISFKHISIDINGNGKAIGIINKVKEISIENCIFNLTNGSALYRNNYSTGVAGDDITTIIFKNNIINEGLNGIYIRNANVNSTKNIEITGNIFNNVRKFPIRIDRAGREYDINGNYIGDTGISLISNNKIITKNGSMTDFTGIYLYAIFNELTVSNNLVYYRNSGSAANVTGLHESNCGTTSGSVRQYWYNNVVDLNAVPSSNRILTGLKIQNGSRQNFVYNTFKLDGSDHIYGMYYTYNGTDNIIQNNDFQILMATPFSYAFVSHDSQNPTGSINTFNNNNYYHLGDDFAKWLGTGLTTFQDFKTTTGFDANSVTQQTTLQISDDYQAFLCHSLNGLGSYLDYVPEDYNGNIRDTNSSTIGAVETIQEIQLIDNGGVLEATNFLNQGTYNWYLNGSQLAAVNNIYTPLENGDYQVEFVDFGTCTLMSNTVTISNLNTNNFTMDTFTIYPNPVKNILTIKTEKDIFSNILIYNIFGKKVKEFKKQSNNQIDISDLNKGIYFIKINNTIKKIIKI